MNEIVRIHAGGKKNEKRNKNVKTLLNMLSKHVVEVLVAPGASWTECSRLYPVFERRTLIGVERRVCIGFVHYEPEELCGRGNLYP